MTNQDLLLLELVDVCDVLSETTASLLPEYKSIAKVKDTMFKVLDNYTTSTTQYLHAWLTKVECPDLPDLPPIEAGDDAVEEWADPVDWYHNRY